LTHPDTHTYSQITPETKETRMDIIVFGATSFVGQILCRYLWQQYDGDDLQWAIAGRSEARLTELRESLGASPDQLPLIVADASDPDALEAMCAQTRVVISTVGPYALYGEPLIQACVKSGTDYCDLTGEVQWIRRMITRYEEAARDSGARIVHCCGFDSIPSDYGVYFLQQQAKSQYDAYCTDVRMRVRKIRGGASGGTIASLINVAREAAGDPKLRHELANPYSLCPPDHGLKARQRNIPLEYEKESQSWIAPFIMAGINTRIVHRSHALNGESYGPDFLYEEAMLTGDGRAGAKRARRTGLGTKLFMIAVAIPPTRWLLQRFLPKPGEGPSPEEQENGCFELVFRGRTEDGDRIAVEVTGDRDPGYGSTAKMLGETGVCLAMDLDKSDKPGGFWTPTTAFGDRLIRRLEQHAGLTFQVLDKDNGAKD